MKNNILIGGVVFLSFLLFIWLVMLIEVLSIQWHGVTDPMRENVKREVFEETKSYNEGKIQQLAKYKFEYDKADSFENKQAIESVVRTMFADFDADNINNESLQTWLVQIRGY